jgi:hypothetical protein
VKRTLSEEEALRLKDFEPFSVYRQDSKACFPGDTQLCVKGRGWVNLSTIIPEVNSGKHTPCLTPDLEVLTPSGEYAPVEYTIFGETTDWIEFNLENGDTLRMTPDHICIIMREGLKIQVRADEVQGTDCFLSDQI